MMSLTVGLPEMSISSVVTGTATGVGVSSVPPSLGKSYLKIRHCFSWCVSPFGLSQAACEPYESTLALFISVLSNQSRIVRTSLARGQQGWTRRNWMRGVQPHSGIDLLTAP